MDGSEVDKAQVVESEGVIHRMEVNGVEKMDLEAVGPESEVDTLHLTPVDNADEIAQEGIKDNHHHDNDPSSPSSQLAQRIVSPKPPLPKHMPKLETAPALQSVISPVNLQGVSLPPSSLPQPQQIGTPSAISTQQQPQHPAHPNQAQQQQPQQTADGKAVKRGRGGRRIGAGRKRKVDSIAKAGEGGGSPTASPSQAKAHNANSNNNNPNNANQQTSPSSTASSRNQLHGNLPTETNTPSSKPAKKKKLYDELSDGVKNSSRQLKFGYTILYVKEVEKTVEFYERAFGLKRRFVHESKQYAEMDTGVTALSFASNELAKSNLTPVEFRPNEPTQLPPGMEIAFSSFDVQRDYKRAVDAGAKSVSAPKVLPWGQIVAYVRDLNGVLVEIASTSATNK